MSSSATFEIKGADELADKIDSLMKAYPSETEAELEKVSNDFKKDVNKKFPQEGKGTTTPVAKKWKKTKLKGAFSGMTTGVELQNTAPHFHLVENGHELYLSPEMYTAYKNGTLQFGTTERKTTKKGGKHGLVHMGFVPGKHYCEKTRNEWNNGEFADRVEKHVTKLLKKTGLT